MADLKNLENDKDLVDERGRVDETMGVITGEERVFLEGRWVFER
jgi:hypothetical protein